MCYDLSVEGKRFKETRPLNQSQKPTEVQTMPSDLSTLDLATINAAQGVIVAAIRNQCCQWEQDSADAAADGRHSNAVMVQNWAFAACPVSTT